MQSHLRCQEHEQPIDRYCQEENCQNKDKRLCCQQCADNLHNHKTTNIMAIIKEAKDAQQKLQLILNQVEDKLKQMTDLTSKITKFIKTDLSFLTDLIENFNFKTLKELQKGIKIANKKRIDQISTKSQIKILKNDSSISNNPIICILSNQLEQIDAYQKQVEEQKKSQVQNQLLKSVPNCLKSQGEILLDRDRSTIDINNELLKGQSLYQQQKYKDAQNIYEKLFDKDLNNLSICLQIGLCLRKQKLHQESLKYFELILQQDSYIQQALYEKSQVLFMSNDSSAFESCIKSMKNHPQKNLVQGQLLMLKGDLIKAFSLFDTVVQEGQNDNEALMYKAETLIRIGQFDNLKAAQAILKSLKTKNFDHERLIIIENLLKKKQNPDVIYT